MNSFCHHTATVGKKVVAPWLLLRPTYCISTKIGESLVKEVSRDFFFDLHGGTEIRKSYMPTFFFISITALALLYYVLHTPPSSIIPRALGGRSLGRFSISARSNDSAVQY